MKNLGLKIVAVVLACALWYVVSAPRGRIRDRIVTASLSVVGVPSELIITTDIPGTVSVQVRGPNADLRALASQSLEASVDLSTIRQAGEVEITLRAQSVNVPEEIEVVKITPNKIRFRIENVRNRVVLIRPYLVGTPPAGYVVGEATAYPDRALVSGPASQILKLSEVTTERIIMTGRTATFVQTVAVVSDSALVQVVSPLTTQVTVPVLAEIGPVPLPTGTETDTDADDTTTDTSGTAPPATTTATTTEKTDTE